MGKPEHKEEVAGLYWCPKFEHRVTLLECDGLFFSDAGCPNLCAERMAALGSVEEIPTAPPQPSPPAAERAAALAKKGEGAAAAADKTADMGIVVLAGEKFYQGTGKQKNLIFNKHLQIVGRVCTRCGVPKLRKAFNKNKNLPGNMNVVCRYCRSAAGKTAAERTPPQPSPPVAERAAAPAESAGKTAAERTPLHGGGEGLGEVLESEYPSAAEILAAISEGAYRAAADAMAGAFERIAANIRKQGEKSDG
ncbi:MAG: hypothetical protein U5L07_07880 [Desulfobacterales bacterium]|nr:hypothetical protein [Desulfobacterales bacterium]